MEERKKGEREIKSTGSKRTKAMKVTERNWMEGRKE